MLEATPRTEDRLPIRTPERFTASDWATKIQTAREARESARRLRDGARIAAAERRHA